MLIEAALGTGVFVFFAWVGFTDTGLEGAAYYGTACVAIALGLAFNLLDKVTLEISLGATSITRGSCLNRQRQEFSRVKAVLEFTNIDSTIIRVYGDDGRQISFRHRQMIGGGPLVAALVARVRTARPDANISPRLNCFLQGYPNDR
ncbi:MAG TPA: hypothetical protein VHN99_10495 [Deinococcales bacterium]|nr:hypothetical protein [Deinococcales bacterium]